MTMQEREETMSDLTAAQISRRQLLEAAGTAAAVVAATSLANPGAAETKSTDLVPFKAAVTAPPVTALAVPANPPIRSVQQTSTGQSDLLGAFTWTDRHAALVGFDGTGKAVTGESAFAAANGDAVFLIWIGLIR